MKHEYYIAPVRVNVRFDNVEYALTSVRWGTSGTGERYLQRITAFDMSLNVSEALHAKNITIVVTYLLANQSTYEITSYQTTFDFYATFASKIYFTIF